MPTPLPAPTSRSLSARVVLLSLFLSLLFPLPSAASSFDLQAEGPQFRCKRSLDQLTSLKPKHTPKHKNCFMGALEVVEAALAPVVVDGVPSLRLNVTLEPERDVRMMRYKVTFHSHDGHSSIDYKGDDGGGYSMCCDFVEDGRCKWGPGPDGGMTRTVVACPLDQDRSVASADLFQQGLRPVVRGSVTKPQHCEAAGLWEGTLWLLDGFGGAYGKVTAWAHLPPAAPAVPGAGSGGSGGALVALGTEAVPAATEPVEDERGPRTAGAAADL